MDAATSDDAAVFRISEDRALVATADFFTPIVDDPFDFGRIAAANALSDIYAMGARPLFALNLLGFPRKLLGEGLAEEILRGGGEVAKEAGCPILGGHSLDDAEPKYGLSVIGEVHPDRVVTNAGARPGDVLVLTKAIGTGVVATALKNDEAPAEVVEAAVSSMTTLNRAASEAMIAAGAHACTDVTGFGLLGHLRELCRASGVSAEIDADAVPLLPGALELAERGLFPGGSKRNYDDVAADVEWRSDLPEHRRMLLCDAQTSGGLLVAVGEERAEGLVAALGAVSGWRVGRVREAGGATIEVG